MGFWQTASTPRLVDGCARSPPPRAAEERPEAGLSLRIAESRPSLTSPRCRPVQVTRCGAACAAGETGRRLGGGGWQRLPRRSSRPRCRRPCTPCIPAAHCRRMRDGAVSSWAMGRGGRRVGGGMRQGRRRVSPATPRRRCHCPRTPHPRAGNRRLCTRRRRGGTGPSRSGRRSAPPTLSCGPDVSCVFGGTCRMCTATPPRKRLAFPSIATSYGILDPIPAHSSWIPFKNWRGIHGATCAAGNAWLLDPLPQSRLV